MDILDTNRTRGSSSPSPEEMHIVFVDDEKEVLDLGKEYLERVWDDPLAITATTKLDEVVKQVETGKVDCIISDYEMPEQNGLDLLRRIRELDPHLPFILFTARGSEDVASKAISAGITDYLQKEFSFDQFELLANRIRNAVKHYWMVCGHVERMMLLTNIANNISESVFVTGNNYKISYISDVIEDIYGIPKERFEEDPLEFLEYIHPEDRPSVEDWIGQMEADGEERSLDDEYQIEYRFNHPENGWRWIRASLSSILDDDGNYDRMVGTARDITDEKEAIDGLEASEEKFRSIAELSNDAIYRIDLEGIVTYASPAVEEMLGYNPETLVGESFLDYITPADVDAAISAFTESQTGKMQNQLEFDLQHSEGHLVTVEVSQSAIEKDGEVVGVQGVARDITARKKRERDLKQYERIVKTIPDGVFVLDEEGRILVANERAATLAGNDPKEAQLPTPPVTELGSEGLASQDAIAQYIAAVEELLTSESNQTMYRLPLEVDGAPRILEFHVSLRPSDDGFRGTVGVIRDITERVAYEQELERQNERLEQFANTVSHDLRNPLNIAMGRLDLARREYDSPHLETVAESHERMNTLIDDILMLAREGDAVDDLESVALDQVIRCAWATVDTREAKITVESGLKEVLADESRLRQLLENLFRNAVEHGGPRVAVTVGPLDSGDGFYVADNGPGISPDKRDEAFEHGYTTAGSTGFGLAIVAEIVEAHDWDICISKSVDGGCRFEVLWEISQSDASPRFQGSLV